MKKINTNSLMKSFKSMKIVKIVNNGLLNLATVLKIQPKIMYIILSLLAVILVALGVGVASGLGGNQEGMTSGERTELLKYYTKRTKVRNEISQFVLSKKNTNWDGSNLFLINLNKYLKVFTTFKVQQFLKIKDINADGIIVVEQSGNKYVRDNSGTDVKVGEKLYYIDVNGQDTNKDGKIVIYKNSDNGNFYRDNSGTEVFNTSSPYILQIIDPANAILAQTDVDAAYLPIKTQIDTLTNTDDKSGLNVLIKNYTDLTDDIIKLEGTSSPPGSAISGMGYNPYDLSRYRPSTATGYGTKRWDGYDDKRRNGYGRKRSDDEEDYDDYDDYVKKRNERNERKRKDGYVMGYDYDDYGYSNRKSKSKSKSKKYYWNVDDADDGKRYTEFRRRYRKEYGRDDDEDEDEEDEDEDEDKDYVKRKGRGYGYGDGRCNLPNTQTNHDDIYMLKTKIIPPGCPVGGCSTAMSSANNISPAAVNPTGAGKGKGADTGFGSDLIAASGSSLTGAVGTSAGMNAASTGSCIKQPPIPPCPPCERCPEPAFDCKRVPNYNSAAVSQYLPRPVLADFSQFGM